MARAQGFVVVCATVEVIMEHPHHSFNAAALKASSSL